MGKHTRGLTGSLELAKISVTLHGLLKESKLLFWTVFARLAGSECE